MAFSFVPRLSVAEAQTVTAMGWETVEARWRDG